MDRSYIGFSVFQISESHIETFNMFYFVYFAIFTVLFCLALQFSIYVTRNLFNNFKTEKTKIIIEITWILYENFTKNFF